MLFRRRKPADFMEKIRSVFWPKRSYMRSVQYLVKRVLRLSATPHGIAAGVAAGTFISFTPFMGFHIILAAALAYLIAGNILASAIGTAVGNPFTFPFIWAAVYETGQWILGADSAPGHEAINLLGLFQHMKFSQLWAPLIKPMLVGSVPLGLFFGAVFYVLTRYATVAFRNEKKKRLANRARLRAQKGGLPKGSVVS